MAYTTEQLIEILDRELQANWRGERLLLFGGDRLERPALAKALGPEKLSRVYAYRDFRDRVHEYQQEYRVSGLIWRTCRFRGSSVSFPELHNQLIAIAEDKTTLIAAKSDVLDFWWRMTSDLCVWYVARDLQATTQEAIARFAREGEWAEVEATRSELYLNLCWGDPRDCHNHWAKPTSGCEKFVAAAARPSAIVC